MKDKSKALLADLRAAHQKALAAKRAYLAVDIERMIDKLCNAGGLGGRR